MVARVKQVPNLDMTLIMKFVSTIIILHLLATPALADSAQEATVGHGQIEAAQQAAEVRAIFASVSNLVGAAEQIAPTTRSAALRAYLLLREADTAASHAWRKYPIATSNLNDLKAHPVAQLQNGALAAAASRVASLCYGHSPSDCLFTEAEGIAAQIEQARSQAILLSEITKARAATGQFTEAEDTAAKIDIAGFRAWALTRIIHEGLARVA
jgi:hypothetical protein